MNRMLILATLALAATSACTVKTETDSIDTSEDALSADNADSQEAEDGAEDGIENGLGGATDTEQGAVAEGSDVDAIDAQIAVNPGKFFKPAGCVVSTKLAPGKWSHAFTKCTGPAGKVTYNGTIVSTWSLSSGAIVVKHEATNFVAAGPKVTATISGARDVTYTKEGTLLTKHRVGNWSGTVTKNADATKSLPWTHQADFTSTWDVASRCYTRDGSANNSVGGREFGRKVSGFKICGGLFACPSSGQFEVFRKNGEAKLTVTFLGGQDAEVTGARGRTVKFKLFCSAN